MPGRKSRNPLGINVRKMKLESREKIFQETEAVEGEDYTVGDAKGLVCVLAQSTFPMTTNDLC